MRFLAIDHGLKRTGLAISDSAGTLATPHSVVQTQNESFLIESIAQLAGRESVEAIVLGLPLNMDGSEGPRAKSVRDFAEKLSLHVKLPIHFHDERLSSYAAQDLFAGVELSIKDKQKRLDAVAAANILQSFLDQHKLQNEKFASPHIIKVSDAEALADSAAAEFVTAAQTAVSHRGAFYAAISGGKTPELFFKRLAQPDCALQIPWDKTHLFWADERCVPPDSTESNYGLAARTFLNAVPIPREQVYRIHGEYDDCVRAADTYEAVLKSVFDLEEGQFPCFDLIVLGLGKDGHIASLLPDDAGVSVTDALTWPVHQEAGLNRVTLTAPVLQNARALLVLVSGEQKAPIVQTIFSSPPDAIHYPAHVLWPVLGKVLWLVDGAAVEQL